MTFKSYKVLIHDIKILPEMTDRAKIIAISFMIIPQKAHLQNKHMRIRTNWLWKEKQKTLSKTFTTSDLRSLAVDQITAAKLWNGLEFI